MRAQKIDEMVNNPNIDKSTLQGILGMIQSRNAKTAFTVHVFHVFKHELPEFSTDDLKNLIHSFTIDESKVDIPKMRTDRKGVKTLNKKGLHKKKITKSYAKEIASKVWPSVADTKQWTKGRLLEHVHKLLTDKSQSEGVINDFAWQQLSDSSKRTNVVFMDVLASRITRSLTETQETQETPNTENQNQLVVDTPALQSSESFEKVKRFYTSNFDQDISAPGMEA